MTNYTFKASAAHNVQVFLGDMQIFSWSPLKGLTSNIEGSFSKPPDVLYKIARHAAYVSERHAREFTNDDVNIGTFHVFREKLLYIQDVRLDDPSAEQCTQHKYSFHLGLKEYRCGTCARPRDPKP